MSDKFPDHIDPLVFAERRSVVTGSLKLVAFERLQDSLADSSGEVFAKIAFAKLGKRVIVSGTISGKIDLACQYCLQSVTWPFETDFSLVVVSSLAESNDLDGLEPILLEGNMISLHQLVEDEILLALPDYPKHDFRCIVRNHSADKDYDESPAKADNPFSVLAKLKKTGD